MYENISVQSKSNTASDGALLSRIISGNVAQMQCNVVEIDVCEIRNGTEGSSLMNLLFGSR